MTDHLNDIDHVIVLMLENRAFDHLLGYMKAQGTKPAIDGLTGAEAIPEDPNVLGSPLVPVSATAGNVEPDPDAGHELEDVSVQFYGHEDLSFPPGGFNNGFVVNYTNQSPAPANAHDIMKCVDPSDPGRIPALATLAAEFCVCNRWYSSVPGPTWPNRLFAHAGTSGGHVTNDLSLYFMPNIFNRLDTAGLKWRIYYHDFPQALLFYSLWDDWLLQFFTQRFRPFARWGVDLSGSKCRLPAYTFIEPQYFSWTDPSTGTTSHANDQHPSHPIAAADRLVRAVYQRLRKSRCWKHSMLVIVHDEHGGTYDHRFPSQPSPNPDGLISANPPFDFTRYGVRVPAVIVSPWASSGVCTSVYDHTSILATLEKRYGLAPLTARDAVANTLDGCLTSPVPRLTAAQAPRVLPMAAMRLSPEDRRAVDPLRRRVSAYQRALVELALRLRVGRGRKRLRRARPDRVRTEQQGAEVVRDRMEALQRAALRGRRG
jgi:phospholipase C